MPQRRPRSFEELFREWGSPVYRICYHLARHREKAEDLAQDVLLEAYRSLPSFEERSSFRTWLFVIARRRWIRARKSGDHELPMSDDIESISAPNLASDPLGIFELELAIQTLPELLREPFVLVKIEGMKYREVAEILDVPVGTVQSRVHHAAKRLRAQLSLPSGLASADDGRAESGEENPDAL